METLRKRFLSFQKLKKERRGHLLFYRILNIIPGYISQMLRSSLSNQNFIPEKEVSSTLIKVEIPIWPLLNC